MLDIAVRGLFVMIVHNVKVVVIGGYMEGKTMEGMALAILGILLWGLSGICTIP